MHLQCDISIACRYTSESQKSRLLSEDWFLNNGYCLSCNNDRLTATRANTKTTDFTCSECQSSYELKSFRKRPKRNLVDGAYDPFMSRILSGTAPTLILLHRTQDWHIENLIAIHHNFLTPNVIVKRNPLALTARRAGWVGCNIRLDQIALDAQIEVVGNCQPREPMQVRHIFQRLNCFEAISPSKRGWTTLTLKVIRSMGKSRFSLDQLYAKENEFKASYPSNHHVNAKIRQQLQILRDLGYLHFIGNGEYELIQ